MKQQRRIIRTLVLLLTISLSSIRSNSCAQGVNFQENLNWEQILAKAKAEHKYIFMDCYATWCVPCKQMDKEVYTQKEVGDVYNKNFISVKQQMDRTSADEVSVKRLYEQGSYFEKTYAINAYPAFLFFDPDGNAVHKATGYRTAVEFIRLAKDAQNPQKQYYQILKNYKPGTLDTSELKGLAQSFYGQDATLGGKLAADYLHRIPRNQFGSESNQILMINFQSDSAVAALTEQYVKGLTRIQLLLKANLIFIARLKNNKKMNQFAINLINGFSESELNIDIVRYFTRSFQKEPVVRRKVKGYINAVPSNLLFTKEGISLLDAFTDQPSDTGFKIFYKNAEKIGTIMSDRGYANSVISDVIYNTLYLPIYNQSTVNDKEPDWVSLNRAIANQYNSEYALTVVLNAKTAWFKYLVNVKKEEKYWTSFIDCKLQQITRFRYDTLAHQNYDLINTISFIDGFQHATQPNQLDAFIILMKKALEKNPKNWSYYDTYACLLYKRGKVTEALEAQANTLKLAKDINRPDYAEMTKKSIERMKRGEPIWNDKQ